MEKLSTKRRIYSSWCQCVSSTLSARLWRWWWWWWRWLETTIPWTYVCLNAVVCVCVRDGKRFNWHKFLLFSLRFICTCMCVCVWHKKHTQTPYRRTHNNPTPFYGIWKTMEKWFLLFSLRRKKKLGALHWINYIVVYTMILHCVSSSTSRAQRVYYRLYVCGCMCMYSNILSSRSCVPFFLCLLLLLLMSLPLRSFRRTIARRLNRHHHLLCTAIRFGIASP